MKGEMRLDQRGFMTWFVRGMLWYEASLIKPNTRVWRLLNGIYGRDMKRNHGSKVHRPCLTLQHPALSEFIVYDSVILCYLRRIWIFLNFQISINHRLMPIWNSGRFMENLNLRLHLHICIFTILQIMARNMQPGPNQFQSRRRSNDETNKIC